MKTQIDKLFKLAPKLRDELTRHVIPSCHHISCPHVKGLEIYFANGYDTFSFSNDTITLTYYADRIDLKRSVTEKQITAFVELVEEAIKTLKITKETEKQKQIEEKRNHLIEQLKTLENETPQRTNQSQSTTT